MRNKLVNLISYRKEDGYYKKLKGKPKDDILYGIISRELWSEYWFDKFRIGYLKSYYKKGITLTEFKNNLICNMGDGDYSKGIEHCENMLEEFIKGIHNIYKKDVADRMIRTLVFKRMLYKPYMGFIVEDLLIEFLKNEGYEILECSDVIDNDYKIDILIKKNDLVIGIQCKNRSYLKVEQSTKNWHKAKHYKAIESGICDKAMFVLYDDSFNLYTEGGSPLDYKGFNKYIMSDYKCEKYSEMKKILIKFGDSISI